MINWENTARVLEEFAASLVKEYQNNIGEHRASGKLQDTCRYIIDTGNGKITVSLELQKYYKYLEYGLKPTGEYKNPGFKALYYYLMDWVDVKFKLPEPPQLKSTTAAIAHSIEKIGTKPTNILSNTVEDVWTRFKSALDEAVAKDVQSEVIAILHTLR